MSLIQRLAAQPTSEQSSERQSEVTDDPSKQRGPSIIRSVVQSFTDVRPEFLRWLWPGRVPLGMLTILSGNPGGGKTFAVIDLTARITTGNGFPDCDSPVEPSDVLFLNLEDHVRVTQRPRLQAAEADMSRVHRIERLEIETEEGRASEVEFNAGNAASAIRSAASQIANLQLIVIDPLATLMAGTRTNEGGDVRQALGPLVTVAEELGLAIVLVHHNRKGSGSHSSERLSGSLQIGATVRMVWEFFRDEDDEERRLLLPGKNSNGKNLGGLACRVVDSEIQLSDQGDFVGRVEWESSPIKMSADEVADRQRDGESHDPFPVEWLRDFLGTGEVAVSEINNEARKAGISDKQLRTARKQLKIKPRKSDFAGGWFWQLPSD